MWAVEATTLYANLNQHVHHTILIYAIDLIVVVQI